MPRKTKPTPEPTPADYKAARVLRFPSQAAAAAALDVSREVIARRETTGPISREAWLALQSQAAARSG